jgi:hypothetical protein
MTQQFASRAEEFRVTLMRLERTNAELVAALKWALPRLKEVGGEDNPQWVDAWAVLNRAKGQS